MVHAGAENWNMPVLGLFSLIVLRQVLWALVKGTAGLPSGLQLPKNELAAQKTASKTMLSSKPLKSMLSVVPAGAPGVSISRKLSVPLLKESSSAPVNPLPKLMDVSWVRKPVVGPP